MSPAKARQRVQKLHDRQKAEAKQFARDTEKKKAWNPKTAFRKSSMTRATARKLRKKYLKKESREYEFWHGIEVLNKPKKRKKKP